MFDILSETLSNFVGTPTFWILLVASVLVVMTGLVDDDWRYALFILGCIVLVLSVQYHNVKEERSTAAQTNVSQTKNNVTTVEEKYNITLVDENIASLIPKETGDVSVVRFVSVDPYSFIASDIIEGRLAKAKNNDYVLTVQDKNDNPVEFNRNESRK